MSSIHCLNSSFSQNNIFKFSVHFFTITNQCVHKICKHKTHFPANGYYPVHLIKNRIERVFVTCAQNRYTTLEYGKNPKYTILKVETDSIRCYITNKAKHQLHSLKCFSSSYSLEIEDIFHTLLNCKLILIS